jgi:NADH-quinone oxidoreductase subunit N
MYDLSLIIPELILTGAALGILLARSFWPGGARAWLNAAAVAVLAAGAAAWTHSDATAGAAFGMLAVDGMSRYFDVMLLAGVLLVLWMSSSYAGFPTAPGKMDWGSYAALLLLSAVGLLLLAGSLDFLMIVVALELVGVTSFILTGYLKDQRRSSEAAIKYFLVGAFSTGLMVYGISLLYGVLGSTALASLASADLLGTPKLPLVVALVFVLVGFGFKLAMVPFHMWVPDAYEGAPTPITAYLSVAPKAAAVAVLVRAFSRHAELELTPLLAVLAAATMTLGNLAALRQSNVKRLLAYSSIAQVGYILVGFVASGRLGTLAVLVYALAYLFMNLGAFACVIAVSNDSGTDEADGFDGLAKRSLPLALTTTVFLLSLTGIPPLIGFVGKFAVFAAAVADGWIWLAVIGVLNSVVSLYYYFSLTHRMFFSEPSRPGRVALTPALTGCLAVALFVTVWVGVFPQALLAWVQRVVP